MKNCIIILILLTVSIKVYSKEFKFIGIWQGTINRSKIVVCIKRYNSEDSSLYGSYCYLRHLKPIKLIMGKNEYEWQEENGTGNWLIDSIGYYSVKGRWAKNKSNVFLPIKLTKSSRTFPQENISCGCDSGNKVLNLSLPIYSKVDSFENNLLRWISIESQQGGIYTFQLNDNNNNNVEAINKVLLKDFNKDYDGWDNFYGIGGESIDASSEIAIRPVYWDKKYITFCEEDRSRGGTGVQTPYYSTYYNTYDLSTGQKVCLLNWIKDSETGYYANTDPEKYSILPKLNRLIKSFSPYNTHKKEIINTVYEAYDTSCIHEFIDSDKYYLTPGKKGLVFIWTPDWCHSPCSSISCEVPFKEIYPFLSQKGIIDNGLILRIK